MAALLTAQARVPAINALGAYGGSQVRFMREFGTNVVGHVAMGRIGVAADGLPLSTNAAEAAAATAADTAATSLACVGNGLLKLLDESHPTKQLVVGLLAAGAAKRDKTLKQARDLMRQRGYPCARDLAGVMTAPRAVYLGDAATTPGPAPLQDPFH